MAAIGVGGGPPPHTATRPTARGDVDEKVVAPWATRRAAAPRSYDTMALGRIYESIWTRSNDTCCAPPPPPRLRHSRHRCPPASSQVRLALGLLFAVGSPRVARRLVSKRPASPLLARAARVAAIADGFASGRDAFVGGRGGIAESERPDPSCTAATPRASPMVAKTVLYLRDHLLGWHTHGWPYCVQRFARAFYGGVVVGAWGDVSLTSPPCLGAARRIWPPGRSCPALRSGGARCRRAS